ncbi:putative chromo domain-like protein [Diplodia seriata]|uniref:Putative chromo domain-like protein n=1 Tax=Diplodia seriata TaxID=420778 RepID=A0A0G2E086_9PEZI|nr:putative chromo domain-like protein [Diplodia seriata]
MARPLPRVNAIATVADKAAHNRANRAAKRTRSASVPADRVVRNARTTSSSTAASSKSKVTKKTNTKKQNAAAQSDETYVARAILEEDAKRGYLIDWAGLDGNGEPYEPTWEPKSYANAALKREWKEKKQGKWKMPAERNGEGQVGDIEKGEAQRGEKEVGKDKVQQDGLQDEVEMSQDKALPNGSRKEAAQKHTSSDDKASIDERIHDPEEEAQNNEAQNGTEPDQPSINGRGHKREATNGTHNNELPESSDRNRKRKLETDRANAQDELEPNFALPHTQPDNKKQRLQATRTESAKPKSTKPKAKPTNQKSTKPDPEPQDEGVFPARAITGEKPRYYRVAWEKDPVTGKDFEDTWEPKGNVSQDLVAEWKQQKKGQSQKAPKKPRGRPAKRAHETEDEQLKEEQDDDVYSARAIVDERHRHYLIAWEKDPKTGEDFDDSWEPKSNVSKDLVAEWRQKKKMAPKQQEQQISKSPEKPKGKVASQTVDTPKQTERQTEQGEQQRKQNAMYATSPSFVSRREAIQY